MKGQTTLTAYTLPQLALPCANSCEDCVSRKGPIQSIGGKLMVRCMGTLRPVKSGCSSWTDGKELEYMEQFKPPADFVRKSCRGR
jgi:hypothetical protein